MWNDIQMRMLAAALSAKSSPVTDARWRNTFSLTPVTIVG
jgi:hypothetical protein